MKNFLLTAFLFAVLFLCAGNSLPEQIGNKKYFELTKAEMEAGLSVTDPDSVCGKARKLPDHPVGGLRPVHQKNFVCGVYSWEKKSRREHIGPLLRFTLPKEKVPGDEKYHWYFLGTADLKKKSGLWISWTWRMGFPLDRFYVPDGKNRYGIWLSLKLAGPSYVPGSRVQDSVLIDRVILVPAE